MGFLSGFTKVGFVENYGLNKKWVFSKWVIKVGFIEKHGLVEAGF